MTRRMRIVLGALAAALVVAGIVALAQGMRSQAVAKVQTGSHACQGQGGAGAQGGACHVGACPEVGQTSSQAVGSAGQHVCWGDASKPSSGRCSHAETAKGEGARCAEGALPHTCSGASAAGEGCGKGTGRGSGSEGGCRGMTGAGCSR